MPTTVCRSVDSKSSRLASARSFGVRPNTAPSCKYSTARTERSASSRDAYKCSAALAETCDEALRPLYAEGMQVCSELEKLLVGRICRLCPAVGESASLNAQQRGPLVRIKAVRCGSWNARAAYRAMGSPFHTYIDHQPKKQTCVLLAVLDASIRHCEHQVTPGERVVWR